jgi:hypothetical protein
MGGSPSGERSGIDLSISPAGRRRAVLRCDCEFNQRSSPRSNGTHAIVAAVGERPKPRTVMDPEFGKEWPVAVSNPIFVDVDDGGMAGGDPPGKLAMKAGR